MSLRPRDRIAIGVVLLLALVAGGYKLVLSPERSKAKSLISAIAAERAALVTERQSYGTGRVAQAALRSGAAQWAALQVAVPTQPDIPALLRTLQRTADSVHVKIKSISLTGGTATAVAGAPAAAGASATPIPIQLTFLGGYAALDRLVKRLDQFVIVSGAKVRASGPLLSISSVSLSGAPNLTVQITASIYQLPAPAAAGTTTGGQP